MGVKIIKPIRTYKGADAEAKKEAMDKIDKLEGVPPYNTWSNICYGDGYFAASIIRQYGDKAGDQSISGIKEWALS